MLRIFKWSFFIVAILFLSFSNYKANLEKDKYLAELNNLKLVLNELEVKNYQMLDEIELQSKKLLQEEGSSEAKKTKKVINLGSETILNSPLKLDFSSSSEDEIHTWYDGVRSSYSEEKEFSIYDNKLSDFIDLGFNNPELLIHLALKNPNDGYLQMAMEQTINHEQESTLLMYLESNEAVLDVAIGLGMEERHPEVFSYVLYNKLISGQKYISPNLIMSSAKLLNENQLSALADYAVYGNNQFLVVNALNKLNHVDTQDIAIKALSDLESRLFEKSDYEIIMLSYELARLGNKAGLDRFYSNFKNHIETDSIDYTRRIRDLFSDSVQEKYFEENYNRIKFNPKTNKWFFS